MDGRPKVIQRPARESAIRLDVEDLRKKFPGVDGQVIERIYQAKLAALLERASPAMLEGQSSGGFAHIFAKRDTLRALQTAFGPVKNEVAPEESGAQTAREEPARWSLKRTAIYRFFSRALEPGRTELGVQTTFQSAESKI